MLDQLRPFGICGASKEGGQVAMEGFEEYFLIQCGGQDGLRETIESFGARVVFNEIQRQFSMPHEEDDIIDLYLKYTYPYEIEGRIEDIKSAIKERELDGLIHYTQTFCFRQIYDIILRESLSLPILTLEADRPGKLDSRTALRLETFVEMLRDEK